MPMSINSICVSTLSLDTMILDKDTTYITVSLFNGDYETDPTKF